MGGYSAFFAPIIVLVIGALCQFTSCSEILNKLESVKLTDPIIQDNHVISVLEDSLDLTIFSPSNMPNCERSTGKAGGAGPWERIHGSRKI